MPKTLLRGKRLYLDAARIGGPASVASIVTVASGRRVRHRECRQRSGSGRASHWNDPQMAVLRGRLRPADLADLAAYLGDPSVASPVVRVEVGQNPGETAPAGKRVGVSAVRQQVHPSLRMRGSQTAAA